MPLCEGLGFEDEKNDALVVSPANKEETDLPRFGPPEGNTLLLLVSSGTDDDDCKVVAEAMVV